MNSATGTVTDSPVGLSNGDRRTGARWRPDRRKRAWATASTWETGVVFAFFLVLYSVVGYWVTVRLLAIPFDATARLAHAYFALYGSPAKLAAIGFVWPPVPTLIYLPFAAIKPVATSLVALPLSTAFFAGALLATLNRLFAMLQMRWYGRYPLLLAFGLNPYFAHYAMNGMGEMVYLFFLVLSIHSLIKWHLREESHHLAICGLAMAMALLSRYEIVAYAAALVGAIGILLYARRASAAEAESSLLLYIAPIAYTAMLWLFFNWLIVGDPLFFLGEQVRQRFTEVPDEAVSGAGALLTQVAELNWRLFAPTLLSIPLLVAVAAFRRSLMALILAGLVLLNPLTTSVLIVRAHDLSLLQPRFNMRSMPIVMIAVGWIFYELRGRFARVALVAGVVLAIVASYPLTWNLMGHYKYRFAEGYFVDAIETGENQSPDDVGVSLAKKMGSYINSHVSREHSILADDAQTFLPMLVSGRPQLFFDRIYKGDSAWYRVRNRPQGKVDWVLISAPEASVDLILERYPRAPDGGVPFLRERYRAGKFILFRVEPPTRRERQRSS